MHKVMKPLLHILGLAMLLSACQNSSDALFSDNEKPIVFRHAKTGLYGFKNERGRLRVPCQYLDAKPYDGGYAPVQRETGWGLLDRNGQEIVPCIYDKTGMLTADLALVCKKGLYGIIRAETGEIGLPCQFNSISFFSDDFLAAERDQQFTLIDHALRLNTDEYFDYIFPIGSQGLDGLFIKVVRDGKYGLLDAEGRLVLPCLYDQIGPFLNGMSRVKEGETYGMMDRQGRLVIPCEYDWIEDFSTSGIALAQKENKFCAFDKEGVAVVPLEFDDLSAYRNHTLIGRKASRYGFFDSLGHATTETVYDHVEYISDELALVERNGRFGTIDLNSGQEAAPAVFTKIKDHFHYGYAIVWDGKHYGYLNRKGYPMTPIAYSAAREFSGGRAAVCNDRKWGFIDRSGREVIPCRYDKAPEDFNRGDTATVAVWSEGERFRIDRNGKRLP